MKMRILIGLLVLAVGFIVDFFDGARLPWVVKKFGPYVLYGLGLGLIVSGIVSIT